MRMIRINGLMPFTFRSWAIRVVSYLKSLPGSIIHLVFDDYHPAEDSTLYLSKHVKGRPDRGRERRISDIGQELPSLNEWDDFILSDESGLCKEMYVTKGQECFYVPRIYLQC